VKKRPTIWDMKSSEYSNKTLKMRTREELGLMFSNIEDAEEKKNLGEQKLILKYIIDFISLQI